MGAKKVPEIVPVIEVEKMSIYAALEKYFQTEVTFLTLSLHKHFLISPSLSLSLSLFLALFFVLLDVLLFSVFEHNIFSHFLAAMLPVIVTPISTLS
jgi:hypothetical protein